MFAADPWASLCPNSWNGTRSFFLATVTVRRSTTAEHAQRLAVQPEQHPVIEPMAILMRREFRRMLSLLYVSAAHRGDSARRPSAQKLSRYLISTVPPPILFHQWRIRPLV